MQESGHNLVECAKKSTFFPQSRCFFVQNACWNNVLGYTIISFSACAIAICLQIFYNLYLVNIEDWSALSEMRAVAVVSTVLVIVTILLNALTLFLYRDRGAL